VAAKRPNPKKPSFDVWRARVCLADTDLGAVVVPPARGHDPAQHLDNRVRKRFARRHVRKRRGDLDVVLFVQFVRLLQL
jgi:hypothetical protein